MHFFVKKDKREILERVSPLLSVGGQMMTGGEHPEEGTTLNKAVPIRRLRFLWTGF